MAKEYRIKNYTSYDIETHEVFLDKLAKDKEEELGLTERRFEVPLGERRAYILVAIFLIVAFTFTAKAFFLQIVNGKENNQLAYNNSQKVSLIKADRGIIYDKNFKNLVLNSPAFDLICDKKYFPESSGKTLQEIDQISQIIGTESEVLRQKINDSEASKVLVAENISHEVLLVLEAKINELQGCQIEKNTTRNYIQGLAFAHLLGYNSRINFQEMQKSKDYTSSDYVGKTGLEKYYESYLRGVPGKTEIQKTALGIQKGQSVLSDPKAGNSLVLNIDSDLQKKVYEELEKSIKNVGSKKGAAVAMDPRTGAVLALVSYPSYDNNLFANGISQKDFSAIQADPSEPLFDRAISAQYPTGSTIKPFEAMGALQEKLISPNKIINDPGYIIVQSKYDPSIVYKFGGVIPHGDVDMRKAIAVSSNIYFYTVGGGYGDQQGLGPLRIKKYLSLFGWGQKTGVDLPGEFAGFIPDPEWKKQTKNESWWDGDTYNLSIGQSDLQVTPIQLASAYCVIANGGTLYQPQIVGKIIESGDNKKIVKSFKPQIIRQDFISPENIQIIREGMRDGVNKSYGSSLSLNSLPVKVAAKTGTAETAKKNYFNTWSSVIAPYENPEIVLVVTIEGVEGLRSGTLTVAKEVLDWYFTK